MLSNSRVNFVSVSELFPGRVGWPAQPCFLALVPILPESRSRVQITPGEQVLANYVSADYFRTMEIAILRGHGFTGEELHAGGLLPALVSTAMAQRFWPAENPLGKEFLGGQNRRYQVIGIVPNVSTLHLGQEDGPLFYGLIADTGAAADAKLFLRANRDASSAVSAIPAVVRQIDSNVTVTTESYQQILSEQLLSARRGAILVSARFSGVGACCCGCHRRGFLGYQSAGARNLHPHSLWSAAS